MRLGIDVGATAIKSGLVDDRYNVTGKRSRPTDARDAAAFLSDLADIGRSYRGSAKITSVGIGLPGQVDPHKGTLVDSTNLALADVPVADTLSRELGVPAFVGNDANCAMFGEVYAGEGVTTPNLIMVTVGTGIGGGIRINGKIYRGRNESAGEFGHMCVNFSGVTCRCGATGCWEAYASVTALIRQTRDAAGQYPQSLLARLIEEGGGAVDGRTAFIAAKAGCPVAEQVVETYAGYLAVGIDNLLIIFRPDKVVLAGAVMNEGDFLVSRIKEKIRFPDQLCISKLHSHAGIIGAAVLGEVYRDHKQFV
ncbi:MAG: ROK family protein [Clostridiales bacterium]|nr:ROK family protein [Clostridiales bacterium]